MNCLLCVLPVHHSIQHQQTPDRRFYHCHHCDLIFVDPTDHVDLEQEKKRYEKHQNGTNDLGYQQFLLKFTAPLLKFLQQEEFLQKENTTVLDYGCGPHPILGRMLNPHLQKPLVNYDPFFANDTEVLKSKWDLILSTEVCEHFRNPREEFKKLKSMLTISGIAAFMTQFHEGPEKFTTWWYARDLTHVVFYSEKTWTWLSEEYDLHLLYAKTPVAILKNEAPKTTH